MYRKDK